MQVVLNIDRPRRMPTLGRARVFRMGRAPSAEAEWMTVRTLRRLCTEAGDLVSIRLQPYRRGSRALCDFEALARRADFALCDPVGVTRTLHVDLSPSTDEHLASMSKKTRAKVRHRDRALIDLRLIDDPAFIPACVDAANASLGRTGAGHTRFDFAGAFAAQRRAPDRIRILGVFLPDAPKRLLAYAVGSCHGDIVEYTSAGSLAEPRLRAMSFNYWVVWELMCWARSIGARTFDLGGVTDGGPGDTRAGISAFKRHFSDDDIEVGRELVARIQPAREWALSKWNDLRGGRA
jgi:hypothetical protein